MKIITEKGYKSKMINKIKKMSAAIIIVIAIAFSNISYSDNELDNIEVLTFSADSIYNKGNLDTNKEKHKKLGEIELNRVLSKKITSKMLITLKAFIFMNKAILEDTQKNN